MNQFALVSGPCLIWLWEIHSTVEWIWQNPKIPKSQKSIKKKTQQLYFEKLCGQTLSIDARRHGRAWLDEKFILWKFSSPKWISLPSFLGRAGFGCGISGLFHLRIPPLNSKLGSIRGGILKWGVFLSDPQIPKIFACGGLTKPRFRCFKAKIFRLRRANSMGFECLRV